MSRQSLLFRASLSRENSMPRRTRTGLSFLQTWMCVVTLALVAAASALAQANDYTTIVVFGDSLSDTGNVAHLTEVQHGVRIPGPLADYTDGRFTDGYDTAPPALNYFGTWVEQFAASLPGQPEVRDSLDGGTNYAYGFATTGNGTSPLALGPLTVQVDNIGQQITDYLSTHPTIDNHTLFIVWGGAVDLLYATSSNDIFNAAVRQTLNIQRLIQAGATQFLVPNLPPLGLTPRFNGSAATALSATTASLFYNGDLAIGISVLRDFYPRRHLAFYQLDVFKLLRGVVSAPSAYSLVDVEHSAQGLVVDPDTYLFWDDLHPTTRGHNILASAATNLVTQ
ncbi:MAG: SGNH/GDSL hydrolase family protein [Terracidiphilus sp.]